MCTQSKGNVFAFSKHGKPFLLKGNFISDTEIADLKAQIDVRNRTEIQILSADEDWRQENESTSTKSYMPVTV